MNKVIGGIYTNKQKIVSSTCRALTNTAFCINNIVLYLQHFEFWNGYRVFGGMMVLEGIQNGPTLSKDYVLSVYHSTSIYSHIVESVIQYLTKKSISTSLVSTRFFLFDTVHETKYR